MPGRLIAIGDIHGHSVAFERLLEAITPEPSDTIVTLGDCVNRGPDSCGVLTILCELRRRCHVISILGNHDDMMLDSRHDARAFNRWLYQGAEETLRSYGESLEITDVPDAHWELLAGFVPFYETDDFIFTHANYCWYQPMDQQPSSLLRWTDLNTAEPRAHISGKTVILGHTPGLVRDAGHYRCIDTGSGFGGHLTAMEVRTGQCWQVSEDGT